MGKLTRGRCKNYGGKNTLIFTTVSENLDCRNTEFVDLQKVFGCGIYGDCDQPYENLLKCFILVVLSRYSLVHSEVTLLCKAFTDHAYRYSDH